MPTPFTSDEEFDAHFRRGLEHDADWSALPDADAWQRMEQLLDAEPAPPAPRRVRRGRSALALLLLLLVAGLSWYYQPSHRRGATGRPAAVAGLSSRVATASPAPSSAPTAVPATPLAGPPSLAAAPAAARPAVVAAATPDTTSYLVATGAGSSPSRRRLLALPLGSGTEARRQPATAEVLVPASQSRKQATPKESIAAAKSSLNAAPAAAAELGLPANAPGAVASGPAAGKALTPLANSTTSTTRRRPTHRTLAATAAVAGRPGARRPRPAPAETRQVRRASLPAATLAPAAVTGARASDGVPKLAVAISARTAVAPRRATRHRGNSSARKNLASKAVTFDAGTPLAARAAVPGSAAPAAQTSTEQPPQAVSPLAGTGWSSGRPDSLPAALPLARVTPFDSLPRPKPLPAIAYRLHIGLLAAPELSAVRQQGTGIGGSAGIEVEYRLAARWRLSTGYLQAIKHYAAAGSDYRLATAWPSSWVLNDVTASCRIIDVPLNLRYDVWQGTQRRAFVSGGLSSLFMRREDYTYHYEVGGKPRSSAWQFLNYSNHPFQVLNLTVGYEQRLSQRWALQVEPYLKLPLGGVGYGAVRLQSAGVFFSLKYGLLRGPAAR